MAVALSTIIFLPLSASPGSDRTAASIGVAHRSAQGTPDHANRFAGRETLGRRTAMRTLEVALESGGKADSSPGSDAAVSERAFRDVQGIASASRSAQGVLDGNVRSGRSETCRSAVRGLKFYVRRANDWRAKIGAGEATRLRPSRDPSCPYTLWRAKLWRSRSFAARQAHARWLERRTLRDFPFAPGADAWPRAVREVQRVFPGTEGWLLACSAAEGGHGRWVGYGGQGYSTWLRDSDTVGGPLQFRYSTFTGMFRRAVDHAYAHGFRVPIFPDYTAAWRSALGQALAGGWARWSGNDNSHWSASFGRGC